jgi:hypothetical protein
LQKQSSGNALSTLNSTLPEYEYPGVIVRNTFIETYIGRPTSLDDFYEERRIHSCPVASFEAEDAGNVSGIPSEPPLLRRALTAGAQALIESVATAAGLWTSTEGTTVEATAENCQVSQSMENCHVSQEFHVFQPMQNFQAPPQMDVFQACQPMDRFHASQSMSSFHVSQPMHNFHVSEPTANLQVSQPIRNIQDWQQMPQVLMLSEALQEAQLGSNELPTLGSAGHNLGTCKPCAFFYTKGCGNAAQCTFCHLCPPDEKRKRQKEKQAAFKDMHRQRRQMRL